MTLRTPKKGYGPFFLLAALGAGAFWWLRLAPLPAGLLDLRQAESTTIIDRHGEVLYESRAADGSRASWLTADTLPEPLVQATIAAEDHRFWSHPGIDPIALARAALRDLRHRRIVEGGSTITQQVAKLLVSRQPPSPGFGAPSSRGFLVKAREAVIALRLEHRFSKREILALYLNLSPYGNQLTGAERASLAYFGQPSALLTPAQAAFLAALPQRPSWFNPFREPARARSRQERVIVQMGLVGALTPDQVREAMDERLSLSHEPSAFVAPHFVERVLAQAGPDRSPSIETTLDAGLQREVQGIIRAAKPSLDRYGAHNVAAVVLDNQSGEWLAWEGSGDYSDTAHGGAIDGVTSPRQPGSALKPFTYALAFELGESPATVLADVPSYFPTAEEGVLYAPRNYDNQFRGPLLARRALAGSENVPAVALASQVGVANLLRFLRTAGFTTFDKTAAYYGLGVTLGDAEVRLDELVAAYAAFARGGVAVQPSFVRGRSRRPAGAERRVVSPRTAFWITDILSDDEARAFAFGRGGSLEFPFQVAAKTGTSQGYHDNWTIGYTRDVTVGVWVGNFDRQPLVGSSGVSGAGPIFHAIMLAAEQHAAGTLPRDDQRATIAPAQHTVRRTVCALSGLAAAPWCPAQVEEWVAADVPLETCAWHRPTPTGVSVDWPEAYQAWAAAQSSVASSELPVQVGSRQSPAQVASPQSPATVTSRQSLKIFSPPDGAVYLIDPTLRAEFQTVPLRASSDRGPVAWLVDGEAVRPAATGSSVWSLAPGRHRITAHDDQGGEAEVAIIVN